MTGTDNDKDTEIAELKALVKAQGEQIKALAQRLDPPPSPPQPARLEGHAPSTYQLIDKVGSIPPNVFQRMVDAIPDDVIRDIAKDGRR
jgi:hypothetical protein